MEVPPGYWTREGSHAPLPVSPFSEAAISDVGNSALRGMVTELGLLFDGLQMRTIGGHRGRNDRKGGGP